MLVSVTKWLEQLGLGQYAEAFEKSAIGPEHLPDLDHETLKEIGVPTVGHRMTLLKAAAELDGSLAENETSEDAEGAPPAGFGGEAERRQLTVIIRDLVGSSELSRRLDPELPPICDVAPASAEAFQALAAIPRPVFGHGSGVR